MVHMKKNRHAIKQAKKEAREKKQEAERAQTVHTQRKGKTKKYSIIAVISIIVIFSLFFFVNQQSSKPGPHDAFAQCLTENDATMYGAYWCPHCAEQKKMFASSFKYVEYVECDSGGKNAEPEKCDQAGITSYPTWIIAGEKYPGAQPMVFLAEKTGCTL